MLTELQAIFENVDKEILNEETLAAISTLIEQTVEKTVNDRLVLETEAKLLEMDEDHADKFRQMLEAIDRDHTAKVEMVVEAINKDHANKFLTLRNLYEQQLKKTAINHRDQFVESINEFLDIYVEQHLPTEMVEEAAKNKYYAKILSEAKEILGVDEKYTRNNIREAIKDGKNQMDQLVRENSELRRSKLVEESRRLVAEKTANMPADMAKFVRARFANKAPDFIRENYKYVVEMYERKEQNEKRSALNDGKTNFNVDRKRVADEIIKESSENIISDTAQAQDPNMALYLEGMAFRK
jgi:hypothetical protein